MHVRRTEAAWILLAGAYALAGLAVARFVPAAVRALPGCPFLALTGLPCPTCGVSRAALALARGDLPEAFARHPCATLAAVLILAAVPWAAVHVCAPRAIPLPRLDPRHAVHAARAFAVALLANWAYLLAGSLAA